MGQQQALADVGLFPGIKFCGMRATDTLDVNDVFTETVEDEEEQKEEVVEEQLPLVPQDEEEDFVIEEFDD